MHGPALRTARPRQHEPLAAKSTPRTIADRARRSMPTRHSSTSLRPLRRAFSCRAGSRLGRPPRQSCGRCAERFRSAATSGQIGQGIALRAPFAEASKARRSTTSTLRVDMQRGAPWTWRWRPRRSLPQPSPKLARRHRPIAALKHDVACGDLEETERSRLRLQAVHG